jgi:hypothetical protein
MPSSEKRIAANRANAAKSTGPTTAAGLRNSSRNGTRHGILANEVLVDHESRDRFATLLNSFNADFQPENNTERMLVEKMAVSHWRLMRLWAVESAGIIRETRRQPNDSPDNAATRTMIAIRSIGDTDRHPDLMGRYEHRYDRQYYRALEALMRVQGARKTTPVPYGAMQPKQTKGQAESGEAIKTPGEAMKTGDEPTQDAHEAIVDSPEPTK